MLLLVTGIALAPRALALVVGGSGVTQR
jgi:hypothetical protein